MERAVRSTRMVMVLFLVMFLMTSCSLFKDQTLKESWNKLTPDEQARIIVGGFQNTLDTKVVEGIALVKANPQIEPAWKTRVLPAFDKANKTLKSITELAQAGKITPEEVYTKFKQDFDQLILYALQIGLKIQ